VTRLDPAVAAVRGAVRPALQDAAPTVLVACSGGADSLALLAATVAEAGEVRVVGVVVDHGLQDGSAEHTARVVTQMASLGCDETASIRVRVDAGPRGVEAGAREARYAALTQLAEHFAASAVLLGHTLDDQAETVLLGLTRGSGGRSIAGMRPAFDGFRRPLLGVTRAQTEACCRALGIDWWEDPHNADPRFVRSRLRHTVLPELEHSLGPGVAAALARTAESVREDVDHLDDEAEALFAALSGDDGLDSRELAALPGALRHRVVRLAALAAGALPSDLTRAHVLAVADLLHAPHDDRLIRLPGHLTAYRSGGLLRFRSTES
jgi:tRNA(Ile)-lysidine synthase